MIEDLAVKFVVEGGESFELIGYGLLIAGAIIAAIAVRSEAEIARAPYFAYSAVIGFAISAVQIVWLLTVPAVAGGYLSLIVAVWFASLIVGGYFLCDIAMARSRDAYGHARMGFLAFIPVANFWLLLTPSKNKMSANRAPTIPLLSGGLGVLTGFVALAATVGVNVYLGEQARVMEQAADGNPSSQQAGIEQLIRTEGLEETLRVMAAGAEAETPISIDDVTVLSRVEAHGIMLRRTYSVDLVGMEMTEELRSAVREAVCDWPPFQALFQAGGAVQEVYVEPGGRDIGVLTITQAECRY